ncbi:hypothetical protein YC2023_052931 [Brassica napus]|uniref:(rape) hypothetical protein n=1 Tax=Brassica napus TaxID=3708 RepID=A0A816JPA6_BRANA|nr:unnamed protein product [Brassica napus]
MTGLKTLVQFLRSCDGGDGRSDAQGVKRSKLETQQNNHHTKTTTSPCFIMSRRKTREPKEETVTLGPAVRDGEQVFGVVHIFASSNDTFIVSNQPLKADRDESSPYAAQDVAQRCKVRTKEARENMHYQA